MTAAVVVALALATAVLAVLVVGLLRSHAEILRALHDLGVNLDDDAATDASTPRAAGARRPPSRLVEGVAAPSTALELAEAADLTGELPGGGAAHVAVTGVDHHTLLAFLSTGCGTCGVFWDELRERAAGALDDLDAKVVVVTNGPESESPAAVQELAPADVVTVMTSEAWDDYRVPVSPYFVLVDGRRGAVVGEGAGTSWAQVVDLLRRSVAELPLTARANRDLTRMGGQDRAEWVDRQLIEAGIEPGDPSLYHAPVTTPEGDAP